jgi:hypothetical protein
MARSRYSNTEIIDGKYYGTFRLPVQAAGFKEIDLLQGIKTLDYEYKLGDRIDHLAARFFNDEGYWWVICIVNNIAYPFSSGGLVPGRILKIPHNVQDVLDRILR